MGTRDPQGENLRRRLDQAVAKGRNDEVTAVLAQLEAHEPREPRWPHRLGDALQRAGRNAEAELAYARAMDRFAGLGFLPQAVAVGKLLVALNPARAETLGRIDQETARSLRPPLPRAALPTSATGAVAPAAAGPPSFLGGIPNVGLARAARRLEPAPDQAADEVRFADVAAEDSITIDVADLDAMLPPGAQLEQAGPYPCGEPLDAERFGLLSAAALFADVSPTALGEIALAAELRELEAGQALCRKGEPADALFVIVEGTVLVALPWLAGGGVELAAGQVLGEACLLRGGSRQADVFARGRVSLLRIAAADLAGIVADHPDVHQVLFDLLAARLLGNTLQTSSLFAAFDLAQRKEIARLCEVRLAPAGCRLEEVGKRSDGLYLLVAGELAARAGDARVALPQGSLIGHRSLLTRDPAEQTVEATADSIVLRLPVQSFAAFAMQYPPALAHLTELAAQPLIG